MLRWFQTGRFAPHHSPTREQREVMFAKNTTVPGEQNETTNIHERVRDGEGNTVVNAIHQTRIDLEKRALIQGTIDPKAYLAVNYKGINQLMGTNYTQENIDAMKLGDIQKIMSGARTFLLERLALEQKDFGEFITDLSKLDLDSSPREDLREFCELYAPRLESINAGLWGAGKDPVFAVSMLQGIFTHDIERDRKSRLITPTGVHYSFQTAEQFKATYLRDKARQGEAVPSATPMPNAYTDGRRVIVNTEDKSFEDPLLRARAIQHELGHIVMRRRIQNGITHARTLVSQLMKDEQKYEPLRVLLAEIYGEEYVPKDDGFPRVTMYRDRAAEEAITIYLTQKKYPINDTTRQTGTYQTQAKIAEIIDARITSNTELRDQIQRIDQEIQREMKSGTFDVLQKFAAAREDHDFRTSLEPILNERNAVVTRSENGSYIASNADMEQVQQGIQKELGDADAAAGIGSSENSNDTPVDAETTLSRAKTAHNSIQRIIANYTALRNVARKELAGKDLTRWEQEFQMNLALLGDTGNDLSSIERNLAILKNWKKSEQEGGPSVQERSAIAERLFGECDESGNPKPYKNPYLQLGKGAGPEEISAANLACEAHAQNALKIMDATVRKIEGMTQKLQGIFDESSKEGSQKSDSFNIISMVRSLANSSSGKIIWITPLNILNIFNTYKQAIVDNYNSNQKVKENRYAKNLNFYKPIDHTLKQIARSSNNEETNKFAEYLKTEGYTFDDLFGSDGKGEKEGILFDNRQNFNRAKAVIDYAAERGMLYYLDRLDGTNVYGLDYIVEEGQQSFDELVQKNEQGKKSQIDEGYQRIDVDANVPPIIDMLIHELSEKRIFSAVGIIKRLQEKAKYSHSNTWAAVTFLSAMRGKYSKNKKELKHVMDVGALDQIGNIGIGQSAWTLTMFKTLRGALVNWKNGGPLVCDDNPLAKAIDIIEKRFDELGISFEGSDEMTIQKAKDQKIAEILSGKTMIDAVTGRKISIFDKEFDFYRRYWIETPTTTSAKESDDDWFNPDNGGSDVLLLGNAATFDILRRQSQGPFENHNKAPNYFAMVFMRDDDLKKQGMTDALNNYQKEMRAKMDYYGQSLRAAGREQFLSDRTLTHGDNPAVSNLVILDELIKRKLISEEVYCQLLEGAGAKFLSSEQKKMYRQIKGEDLKSK